MSEFNVLIYPAVALFIHMTVFFLLALYLEDNSIADIAWGLGFIVVAVVAFLKAGIAYPSMRHYVVLALVTLWGLRLSLHIYMRNNGKGEDWRYKKWREDWGSFWIIRSYLQVFLLQGVLLLVIAFPAMMTLVMPEDVPNMLSLVDFAGIGVWLIGFFFEAVGDYQLLQFTKDPINKEKIIQSGLWKYTRHPNYFGEMTMWWGIWLISLSNFPWYFTIVGPLTITILLTKVSGIPLLEKKMLENPEFREYAKRTSVLIPWFPKKI